MRNHDGDIVMTTRQSTTMADGSLGRAVLSAARYYLGNRWMLLALGAVAVVLGLAFGGWGWLVAAGLAPIILSTLPCLIMCGLGVCAVCLAGKKESASVRGAVEAAASPSELGIAKTGAPLVAGSSCCHEDGSVTPANALAENATTEWKEKTHA
jgi:hypothetical protein